MTLQEEIEAKLKHGFQPLHFEIQNESHRHKGPRGAESHFRVVVVSSAFVGMTLIARHRKVYEVLRDEMRNGVHALALHTFEPEEWIYRDRDLASPLCPNTMAKPTLSVS